MEALFGNNESTGQANNNDLLAMKDATNVVVAPFHLGFPLDLCRTNGNDLCHAEGMTVFQEVKNTLSNSRFLHIDEHQLFYDNDISVPMGRPLVFKDTEWNICNDTKSYIILFPTGLYLVTVLYFDNSTLQELEYFHENDNSHDHSSYGSLEESGKAFGNALYEWSNNKSHSLSPLFKIDNYVSLIDAYYIRIESGTQNGGEKIEYVNAIILREHAAALLYTYASYYSILWLHKALCRQVGDLKVRLLGRQPTPKGMVENLKAMNLHIRRLIAETNPFSIRITHHYVAALRRFRQAYDMEALEAAVQSQSELLEDAVAWLDAQAKERFNNSIGLAAFFLSLVSITAVNAQLISTLDFSNKYDTFSRFILIFGGAAGVTGVIAFIAWVAWRQPWTAKK